MTGSEKIIAKIKEDSAAACAAILADAKKQAETIAADAAKTAGQRADAITADAEAETERIAAAAKSSSELTVRNALLRRRREEIDKTLAAAVEYLCGLGDDEYFDTLLSIAKRIAQPGNGVLYLNRRDLGRAPGDLADRLQQLGGITLSDRPREICGGFILAYGDIELNAAFDALLEEKRDLLEDMANRELF
jgi:V/A-type H+-transporting ATPase subunit E